MGIEDIFGVMIAAVILIAGVLASVLIVRVVWTVFMWLWDLTA